MRKEICDVSGHLGDGSGGAAVFLRQSEGCLRSSVAAALLCSPRHGLMGVLALRVWPMRHSAGIDMMSSIVSENGD